jgi:preprotein translocase SecE subunit
LGRKDAAGDGGKKAKHMVGRWIILGTIVVCAALAMLNRAKVVAFLEWCQGFNKEVKVEMRKVTWPSKDELIGMLIIVLTTVTVVAIFIGIVDVFLTQIVQFVFAR